MPAATPSSTSCAGSFSQTCHGFMDRRTRVLGLRPDAGADRHFLVQKFAMGEAWSGKLRPPFRIRRAFSLGRGKRKPAEPPRRGGSGARVHGCEETEWLPRLGSAAKVRRRPLREFATMASECDRRLQGRPAGESGDARVGRPRQARKAWMTFCSVITARTSHLPWQQGRSKTSRRRTPMGWP